MPASVLAPREAPTMPPSSDSPPDTPAAEPARSPRAAVVRPTLLGLAVGGAQGALLYGGAIALLHARLNAIDAADALVLLGWCLLVYGAGAAVATGAAMAVLRLVRRLRGALATRTRAAHEASESSGGAVRGATATRTASAARGAIETGGAAASGATDVQDAARAGIRRDLWLAIAAFHFVFWLFAASYGLTYDEAPRWVTSAWPMLGYLVLRSLAVLAVVTVAAWILVTIGDAATRRGRLAAVLATITLLLVAAQLGIALAQHSAPREKPPLPATFGFPSGQRVAVVGVDGADWRVALPMVQRGELPNLARLMAEGSWGPLASFPDSNSAVIWASIYSGRRPAVHGVLDFYAIHLAGMSEDFFGVYPVHRTFFKELALRLQRFGLARVQPIDRSRVAVPLIWEVAHAARRSVGVVDGYYYSYPAPVLGDPGSFFLGYGSDATVQQARDEKRPLTHAEAALQAWPPMLLTTEDRFLLRPDFEWQGSTLLDLLAHYGQPELVTMYSHEPDAVQHARWRFHEPSKFFGVDPATAAEHDDVASFYRQLDVYLGRLRARLSSDTVLVVVSDHGHSPTIFHSMDTQHRHGPPGVLLLHGGPVRAGRLPPNAGVLDVYPTLLYLLGIPVPADADGKVLTAALDPEFIKEHPEKVVSSFDGIPIPRSAAPPDEERRRLELEKLHSLGYIR